jgi:hypothetical protein
MEKMTNHNLQSGLTGPSLLLLHVLEGFPEAFLPPMALWTVSLGSYEPQSFK